MTTRPSQHGRAALPWAAAGFGVLYLAATATLGATPGPTAGGPAVVAWFRVHGEEVRVWVCLISLSVPLFATFAALVRRRLPSGYRDVFFFGAIAFAVQMVIQTWLWAGLAWHPDGLAPATARTLLDVASFWGPLLTGATATMLLPVVALALRPGGMLPRWLGLVGAVALGEQLIETVTVFGRRGFIAPGGPMNAYVGALLVAAALGCLALTLARRPTAAPAVR